MVSGMHCATLHILWVYRSVKFDKQGWLLYHYDSLTWTEKTSANTVGTNDP